MENVTDALKMAGSVLLFVLALSVVIPLISQAKSTADKIMSYVDRETDYVTANFFYEGDGVSGKQRTVGIETVIPSIYRTYKENYKVVFLKSDGTTALNFYKYTYPNGQEEDFNRIDIVETKVPAGDEKEFIDGIFYHKFKENSLLSSDPKTAFEMKYKVKVDGRDTGGSSLFDVIKNKKMKEELGVYYQEDLSDATRSKPESNKDEKRVITYIIQ